jgi:hypothetical protein
MRSVEKTLALWTIGFLSSEEVVAWADAEIARVDKPSTEILDLSIEGPERCLKKPAWPFAAKPEKLTYIQEFSLRVLSTSMDDDDALLRLGTWMSVRCIGEDDSNRMVGVGYQVEHLAFDCRDIEGALLFLREELPALIPECRVVAEPFCL